MMNQPRDMRERMMQKIEDNLKHLQQRSKGMTQGKDHQSLLDPRIAELNASIKEELRNTEELVRNITKDRTP